LPFAAEVTVSAPLPPFLTLLPAATRTTAGNGDAIDLPALAGMGLTPGLPPALVVQSDVTAVSGTASPTLTVIIEDSVDGVNWNTAVTLTAQTAVGRQVARLGLTAASWPFNPRRVRVRYTITGTTPSFTFSVKAVLL
jgi:hypothetical protein